MRMSISVCVQYVSCRLICVLVRAYVCVLNLRPNDQDALNIFNVFLVFFGRFKCLQIGAFDSSEEQQGGVEPERAGLSLVTASLHPPPSVP